jgi:NADH:ubiquinone oxidoreductase subunit K
METKGRSAAIRFMISVGVLLLMLGLFLFFAGILQCLSSRRFLGYLFGIEMVMSAASINLAGFTALQPHRSELQALMLMITALAAIEAAVGLSVFAFVSRREKADGFSLL